MSLPTLLNYLSFCQYVITHCFFAPFICLFTNEFQYPSVYLVVINTAFSVYCLLMTFPFVLYVLVICGSFLYILHSSPFSVLKLTSHSQGISPNL